ncbi:hypothetical protein C8R44DRAFT_794396 [Mycena epipterygia]|nr:hypothetical protein C8R44DRAFT_794396 [Mycena epipterygia]
MPEDRPIIVIIGERSAGKILAQAANRVDADSAEKGDVSPRSNSAPRLSPVHVVTYYYSSGTMKRALFSKPQALPTIEKAVGRQMAKLATPKNIARILFVYSDKAGEATSFPFGTGTRFLNLEGKALFQRLIVIVQSRPDNDLKREWSDLVKAGMRVAIFDGTQDSARVLVAPTVQKMQGDPASLSRAEAAYKQEALGIGRHAEQAVVLLVGHSGHGKSKTINRLLGHELMYVGKSTLGSTTKVIQRVKLPVHNIDTGVTVTIAFDDTPGLEDTTYVDREANASLMRRYKQQYFPGGGRQTYPNVILLIASWPSITPDAHNEPHHFTSAVGKSMYNLYLSGLVDPDRTNVVLVVTKSMSSWDQFDDFKTTAEKNTQWNIEAARRIGIITDLQRKVFPKMGPWPTVFVENGGGSDMGADFPVLPNGELSHDNLFKAIQKVIQIPGEHADLAGMHALDVLSGARFWDLEWQVEAEILLGKSIPESETVSPNPNPPSHHGRIRELADSYLGVMYDPIRGTLGRTRVLSLDLSDIQFSDGPGHQTEEFTRVVNEQQEPTAGPYPPNGSALRAHYSSSPAFESAVSTNSECYELRHIIQVVTVHPSCLIPSAELKSLIDQLPLWSADTDSKEQYNEFFESFGTHVFTKLALGGVLRVIVNSTDKVTASQKSVVGRSDTTGSTSSARSTRVRNVMIFRDGGGSVAAELTRALEYHFADSSSSSDWENMRKGWIQGLEKDPVFCPDDPNTVYEPLHNLQGLTTVQQKHLEQASEFYWRSRHRQPEGTPDKIVTPSSGSRAGLLRQENRKKVLRALVQKFKEALARLAQSSHSR